MTLDAALTAYVESFYWVPFALVVALVAACYVMTRGGGLVPWTEEGVLHDFPVSVFTTVTDLAAVAR